MKWKKQLKKTALLDLLAKLICEYCDKYRGSLNTCRPQYTTVMWSETVGRSTRPVWDQKIGLGLGLAGLVLCCEARSCHARRHNDLEGHSNFSSTIYSFSILCLEHHYCGDQQWLSLT